MGNRKLLIGKKEPEKEYIDTLELDDTIISHIIHSLLHLQAKRGLLVVSPGMSVTKLQLANYDWLQGIIERFETKRKYKVTPEAITNGIYWFLMGYSGSGQGKN